MVFFAELKGGGTRDVLQSASERAVGLLALYRRFFGFGVSRLPSWYGYIGVPFIYAVYLLLPAFFIFYSHL